MNRVAFQGEPGAFSEEAAIQCCGRDVLLVPRRSFNDVVSSVLTGMAERAILPVENSLIGLVAGAGDAARTSGLTIEKEIWLPIRHCLIGKAGVAIDDVRRVISHPAALGQCKIFFEKHPQMEPVEFYDTAGAAKYVAQSNDRELAAIAARRAAERYKLKILAEDIQDRLDNQTRFVVLVKQ